VTPAEFRARGNAYPRVLREAVLARAIPQIERFLPAGDDPLLAFEDDEPVPVGFRFPSPAGILRVMEHGDFELTPLGIDAAFFGDLGTSFEYPWVQEFGTVALLDPLSLSAYKVRARRGWFVCDGAQIVPSARALFVPEQGMAARCEVGMSREDALDAIGRKEHAEATAEMRARATEYVSSLPRIDARCRELQATFALHPDAIREQLRAHGLSLDDLALPTFNLTRAQRDALLHW
jgi:hypothetical protein